MYTIIVKSVKKRLGQSGKYILLLLIPWIYRNTKVNKFSYYILLCHKHSIYTQNCKHISCRYIIIFTDIL